jgi:DNA invertase Pin-like site-specific DNA recombinase
MAKKAILLIRVSTERQDYEAQTTELIRFATSETFGYSQEDLIIIRDKESAIKLSEEERQGLNAMKDAINNNQGNIESVFIWELSRLSRVPKILYSIRDLLLSKKINLIVKEPFLKLLDDNKEIISSSIIQFGFFIALVENEMLDKKARFKRGKLATAAKGKYNGGYIRYGYYIETESKLYKINEDEAKVIRLVYDLYESGKYSLTKIVQELKELGYNKDVANLGKITNILSAVEYTGIGVPSSKLKTVLPAIITKEQFYKCREIAKKNNTKLNKSDSIYYAHQLLKCSCCGKNLQPQKTKNLYCCPDRTYLNKFMKESVSEKCTDNNYLSISYIDSLLWRVAMIKETMFIKDADRSQIDHNQILINKIQKKIDACEDRTQKIIKSKKRLATNYSNLLIDDEEYENVLKSINIDERQIELDKLKWSKEIEHLNDMNNQIEKNLDKSTSLKILKQIDDDETRCELVQKHIKKVIVTKLDKKTKQLHIQFNHNFNDEFYYYYQPNKLTHQIYTQTFDALKYSTPEKALEAMKDHSNWNKHITSFKIVRTIKIQEKKGQYAKVKKTMENDPQYREKYKARNYYYYRCWKIKHKSNLTEEEKQKMIDDLTSEYELKKLSFK